MGTKPWLCAGALLVGGMVLCGCQNQQKTATPYGPSAIGKAAPPPNWPNTPGSGTAAMPPGNLPGSVTPGGYTTGAGTAGLKTSSNGAPAAPYGQGFSGGSSSGSFPASPGMTTPPAGYSSAMPSGSAFGAQPPASPNGSFATGYSAPPPPVGTTPGSPGLPPVPTSGISSPNSFPR